MAYISRADLNPLRATHAPVQRRGRAKKLIGANLPKSGGRVFPKPLGNYKPVGGRRGR